MSLSDERIAHAVTYLHGHRKEFTSDFAKFYGNHDCHSLIASSQDALTRVGKELLNTTPSEWIFEFLESLTSRGSDLRASSKACVYILIWMYRDGSAAAYASCTHVGVETRYVLFSVWCSYVHVLIFLKNLSAHQEFI
jgi:hypothetical protein